MPRPHKRKHPIGKLLATIALLAVSGFAVWQKKPADEIAAAAPTQTATPTPMAIGAYEFHEGPAVSAIAMPRGRHVEDGEYVSQEWESGFGSLQIKVRIKNGAFTGLDYLMVPDERLRSQELSRMSKPLLIHEMLHEQRQKVDVITTATYTTWAFQDALADVIEQATRPRLTPKELEDARNDAHNLEPLYMGNQ